VRIGDRFLETWRALPVVLAAEPLRRQRAIRPRCCSRCSSTVAAAFAPAVARRISPTGGPPSRSSASPSPLTIALDFWEHTLGVAFMAWGRSRSTTPSRPGPGGGVLSPGFAFGAASAADRGAGLPLAIVAELACLVLLVARKDLVPALITGALALCNGSPSQTYHRTNLCLKIITK
jgi:hypothetical protein